MCWPAQTICAGSRFPRCLRRPTRLASSSDRLAPVIGLSPRLIDERVIAGITQLPYAPVTIKTDAGLAALTVLAERQNDFPGVKQEPVSIRSYPYRELAAQTLGHVGSVSEEELKLPAFKGVPKGTVVGQSGLEYYYDRYLRGKPGERFVQVNAEGQPEPTKLPVVEPKTGHDLKLTIDLGLQQEGEKALREGVALAQGKGNPGSGAAFVAMNPLNGRNLCDRLIPELRPQSLCQTDDPERIRPAQRQRRKRRPRSARTAAQPGRGRSVSDRLDLQADHRDGRPRSAA